jgi:Carboxypeptidase regulatory-like domain
MKTSASAARLSRLIALMVCVFTLSGCIWLFDSDDKNPEEAPPSAPSTGSVQGRVTAAGSGTPLAGARVLASDGQSVTTDADGRFVLSGLPLVDRALLRVQASGYADTMTVARVQAGENNSAAIAVLPMGPATSIDPGLASTVNDSASSARLQAPANAFRRKDNQAAPSGALTVRLTSVDPALDPTRMPGDYTTLDGNTERQIESFGAVQVDVRDSAGNPYTLAPGSSATLRIPASSRGALPDTVNLYSLNETTGRWVQEGTATLAGGGTNRWYEATVTHLSWWNADMPLETITVSGCVRTTAGAVAAGRVVRTEGLDYSGSASATTHSGGDFTVAMKRGGVASLVSSGGGNSTAPQVVGPSQTNITLASCLVERTAPTTPPTVLVQPGAQTVVSGGFTRFSVLADGQAPLRYQWQRNGVDLVGATGPVLNWVAQTADNGALFRVRVSNPGGTVVSADAALNVTAAPVVPLSLVSQPPDVVVSAGSFAVFSVVATGSAPLAYQWQRDGVALAGETSSQLRLAATAADNGARFSVVVSNPANSITSRDALLTVTVPPPNVPPVITSNPASQTATVGQQVRFAVAASSATPLRYQWRRNGTNLAGETADSLVLTAAQADNGAVFNVEVSNSDGVVVSANATLNVIAAPQPGSLTVTGALAAATGGSFTPGNSPGTVPILQITPPTCIGVGVNATCVSSIAWLVFETPTTVPPNPEALLVGVSSQGPAPGVPAGTSPSLVTVSLVVGSNNTGNAVTYARRCGTGEPSCPNPADVGLTVNPAARTMTFVNVTLTAQDGSGQTTLLNGTVGY